MSGRLRPGDVFPSVRTLSRELKINPNTAHKVITHLVATGLLEIQSGVGTVVAVRPEASKKERAKLLEEEVEELAVEAKRLGIELEDVVESITQHWKRLSGKGGATDRIERGGRGNR